MPDDPVLWVWQGFFGPMAAAVAGKAVTDVLPGEVAGVKIPEPGLPPVGVDKNDTIGMFAIQTRPASPVKAPTGLLEADQALVGRLIGG